MMMDDVMEESEQNDHGEGCSRSDPPINSSSSSSNSIVQMQSHRRNNRRMSTRSQLIPEPRSAVTIAIPQDASSSSSSSLSCTSVQQSHTKGRQRCVSIQTPNN